MPRWRDGQDQVHHMSEQHLDRYVGEFMFRYNNRHVAATKVERLENYMDQEEE
jgi:hypothetical protein